MYKSARILLVSFGDGPFAGRKRGFIHEAQCLNVFDDILFFNASQLPDDFKERHMPFMRLQSRGFGYWIWKPQVIRTALERATHNDLVMYVDAGSTLNFSGRDRLLEYFEIAMDSPFKMLSFQNVHTECMWTKADLAKRLGVDGASHIMKTSQLSSGLIVLGKTPSNIDLIRQWQDVAVEENYRFSDDSASVLPNHPNFREHRHDQSISSLLRKLRGTTITHYEVKKYDRFFEAQKMRLPVWATRLSS
jgi:hypothetical protein